MQPDSTVGSGLPGFPSQKRSSAQKTKKWGENCVKSAIDQGLYSKEFKASWKEMRINVDLYNNTLDSKEMMEFCDPFDMGDDSFPIKPRNYPIAAPKINLLVGEESKRTSDYRVRVINGDAISSKEKEIVAKYTESLMEMIKAEQLSQEEAEKKIGELQKWRKYEYQDLRERRATFLLEHIKRKETVERKFNDGFKDALITGLEIYSINVEGGEPILRKCNPLNIKVIRTSESPNIEDSDIIIEHSYYSPGKVLDMYHEHLTDAQVKQVESGRTTEARTSGSDSNGILGLTAFEPDLPAMNLVQNEDGQIIATGESSNSLLPFFSTDGSMLVTRVVWRSLKKVGKLKYYDPVTGEEQYDIVSEFREPDIRKGEEIEWFWVTDWWEGTRIGKDLYVNIRPYPIKAYSMSNPAISMCPYVGMAYTINDEKVTSLMGRMKPYQYLYNAFMWKTQEAFAKYKGVVGTIDLARTPRGWEFEDVLYYAERLGWIIQDSFKEGDKGAATGKLAGNLGSSQGPMNFDMSGYIQQNIAMLNYLKIEMGEISGVSKQREGQIENRELVGNVERSVTQSSHITEQYFAVHESIKQRVLTGLIEAAKFAYRGQNKKIQFVLDDMSTQIFDIDGDQFRELDYDLVVSNSTTDSQTYQQFIQLAQAGLQNDKLNFSNLLDIMTDRSISSIRRKIETAENDRVQQQQQAEQAQIKAQQEAQQQQIASMQQIEAAKLQIELEKIRLQQDHEINMKHMDMDRELALKQLEFAFDREAAQAEIIKENMKISAESAGSAADRNHESVEAAKNRLVEQEKIAAQIQIAKSRPRPAGK